jgi:hypothetical protein
MLVTYNGGCINIKHTRRDHVPITHLQVKTLLWGAYTFSHIFPNIVRMVSIFFRWYELYLQLDFISGRQIRYPTPLENWERI